MTGPSKIHNTTIRVDFLTPPGLADPASHGRRLEWPPHPERLFAALTAAHYEAGVGRRETLEWLERQDPPVIQAEPIDARRGGIAYVPVNDATLTMASSKVPAASRAPLRENRAKQPRRFPTGVLTNATQTVRYGWRSAEVPPDDLEAIVHEVTYLGRSTSFVAASLEVTAVEPTLVPDQAGHRVLRVPQEGRLAALDQAHAARSSDLSPLRRESLRRRLPPPSYQRYGNPPDSVPRTPWRSWWAWTLQPQPHATVWLPIAESVRGAILSGLTSPAPPLLTGHVKGDHLAIVPLVHVDHRHAKGAVLGFAVLLPETDPETRAVAVGALTGIERLTAGPVGSFACEPVQPHESRWTLDPKRWCRKATTWATVTPYLFDRFPKGNQPVDLALRRAIRRIGLPEPVSVSVSRFPTFAGTEHSGAYRVRRRTVPRSDRRPWSHVRIAWASPIAGPLLLGAGRHFGLGFFAPVRETHRAGARDGARREQS